MSAAGHAFDDPLRNIFYETLLPSRARLRIDLTCEDDQARRLPRGQLNARVRSSASPPIGIGDDGLSFAVSPRALPFPTGSIDCILATAGAIAALDRFDQSAFLGEACRALTPRGVLLLDVVNAFDLRAWISALRHGLRGRVIARRLTRGRGWGGWRQALRAAGFTDVVCYAVPAGTRYARTLMSVAAAPAATYYANLILQARAGVGTPLPLGFRVLTHLKLMRFLEPSYLITARK